MAHLNLAPDVNEAIDRMTLADEIDLKACPVGSIVTFKTKNTTYRAIKQENDWWLIVGNLKFFDKTGSLARIVGTTFGGSMIKANSIFVGGYVEMALKPEAGAPKAHVITTSQVQEIGV